MSGQGPGDRGEFAEDGFVDVRRGAVARAEGDESGVGHGLGLAGVEGARPVVSFVLTAASHDPSDTFDTRFGLSSGYASDFRRVVRWR